jgi:hypothetical protein
MTYTVKETEEGTRLQRSTAESSVQQHCFMTQPSQRQLSHADPQLHLVTACLGSKQTAVPKPKLYHKTLNLKGTRKAS